MKLKLITPPAVEPVTLDEVKVQLGADDLIDDALLTRRITEAREWVELFLSSALITQTLETACNEFPVGYFHRYPVQSIESITYEDSDLVVQTVDPTVYIFDDYSRWTDPVQLRVGKSWPATSGEINNVKLRFIAGYGDAPADVPGPIREAVIMIVDHWTRYNAGNEVGTFMSKIPSAVEHLLSQYRALGEI